MSSLETNMARLVPRTGQPLGAIFQIGFTVEDLERGMADFTARLKVGPWFKLDYHASSKARYRGSPTSLHVSIVRGFSGHLNVELLQQVDDGPSVYRDVIERRGFGFHHWAIGVTDFTGEVARYRALGYEEAFYDVGPYQNRMAYMDTTRDLPGMVEIYEITAITEASQYRMYEAALAFDGSDPVRI